uniref:(northern house mosquito) hypothetical protein n=1 Tax=Culex pipiens TaxID=7175 RepID=A0A8D8D259_CULPI
MVSSIGRDVVKLSGKTKFLGFGHPVGLRPSAAGTTSPGPLHGEFVLLVRHDAVRDISRDRFHVAANRQHRSQQSPPSVGPAPGSAPSGPAPPLQPFNILQQIA